MPYSADDLDELRNRVRLSDLISHSGIELHRQGREFIGLCPFHEERTPSFFVADDKHFFHCFGCGAHGNAIDFIMRYDNLSFLASIEKLGSQISSGIRTAEPATNVHHLVHSGEVEAERLQRLAGPRALWDRGIPAEGTPAEAYLRSRGLPLPEAPVLRYSPRVWNRETNRELPAMLARVDGPDGEFAAVHRTWLRADGSGKADLAEPRWSWGPIQHGAVRLAPAGHSMVIAEGIENALTATLGTGRPAWSALSAPGLKSLVLPRDVREVVIVADNDRNGVGQDAAREAGERWLAQGRRVSIAAPREIGDDINDVLRRSYGHEQVRHLMEAARPVTDRIVERADRAREYWQNIGRKDDDVVVSLNAQRQQQPRRFVRSL